MALVAYVSGATKAVTTVQPDLTGKALIEIFLPDGLPLLLLLSQFQSFNQIFLSPANAQAASAIVIKVTYGS